MTMANPISYKKDVKLEHERVIWDLRQKGVTQLAIAKEIGMSQCYVSETLRGLYKRYRDELDMSVTDYITEHVVILSYIVQESMGAWETDRKQGVKGPSQRDKDYFQLAMKALEDIRKIHGIGKDFKQSDENAAIESDPVGKLMEILDSARKRESQSANITD
jgi:transcriptional regulator with XRE-family HTH domain